MSSQPQQQDYLNQQFSFNSPQGVVNVTMPMLDNFIGYNVQICINFGAQIGASLAVLVVLVLISKPERRCSPVMLLNSASLVFSIIRSMLQCMYFTGPFSEAYAYFAEDFSRVHATDYAISVTATVFTFLLQICIEASLWLQVRVVCCTVRPVLRHAVLGLSGLIALLAIGFRAAYMVENDMVIVANVASDSIYWLGSATNIVTSISVVWTSAVFILKLGVALRQRRKMHLDRFGPMQVLFIMGCQTLVIPAVFSVLQYSVNTPALTSDALTTCALFLPLSALWASAALDGSRRSRRSGGSPQQALMNGHSGDSKGGIMVQKKVYQSDTSAGVGSPVTTLQGSFSGASPKVGTAIDDDVERGV